MSKAAKSYSVDTVLRAQRRTLRMLARFIESSMGAEHLYAADGGAMTGRELAEHARQAARLRVKR